MMALTPLDQEVLHHIVTFEFRFQRMPTMKELEFYTGMVHGQLCRHLNRLADCGKLQALPRGIIHYAIIDQNRIIDRVPEHLADENDSIQS